MCPCSISTSFDELALDWGIIQPEGGMRTGINVNVRNFRTDSHSQTQIVSLLIHHRVEKRFSQTHPGG